MKLPALRWSNVEPLLTGLWGCALFTMILYRPLLGPVLVLLGLTALAAQLVPDKPRWEWTYLSWALALPILLFAIYLTGYLRFADVPKAWPLLERKAALLAIPLFWALSRLHWPRIRVRLYLWLLAGIFTAATFMLIQSLTEFIRSGNWEAFFYHHLTPPIAISPIYFAWYLAVALFWPLREASLPFGQRPHTFIRGALLVLLLLCASKLFTVITLLLLATQWMKHHRPIRFKWGYVIAGIAIILLTLPAGLRIAELIRQDLEVVTWDSYRYDTPFNGLTLRLVQLRFGWEIMREEQAWMTGVGPVNAQSRLDEKYHVYQMYTGNEALGDRGYLDYNFHNQWMETLVATGIPGLATLILTAGLLIIATYHSGAFASIIAISITFMLSESVLEREQGIVLFSMITSITFKPRPIEP